MIDPCPVISQPWWHWHPPVGSWIAVLALLGVIVPWLFRPPEKMGRGEKAIWTFVMLAFFYLELRTLYLDRDEHDGEQAHAECEQTQQFNQIAQGLESSIQMSREQFSVTMEKFGEAINTETGGDTFCYVDFNPTPLLVDNRPAPDVNMGISVVKVGKYPCRGVNITIQDQLKMGQLIDEAVSRDRGIPDKMIADVSEADRASTTTFPEMSLDVPTELLEPIHAAIKTDSQQFAVIIHAFNSNARVELVNLRWIDGRWKKAIWITDNTGKNDWSKIDKDFPRKDGKYDVNFPHPTNGTATWDR
jgi:hypothetical protein